MLCSWPRALPSIFLTILLMAAHSTATNTGLPSSGMKSAFERYASQMRRTYGSQEASAEAFEHFSRNMQRLVDLQLRNPYATFSLNNHMDTPRRRKPAVQWDAHHDAHLFSEILPAAGPLIDWRERGAVTVVWSQGQCASDWCFAATGSIEGQWKIAGHKLVNLSAEELLSCDESQEGCNGGSINSAFHWLLHNRSGQIFTFESYPYTAYDGNTPACGSMTHDRVLGATIMGYMNIASNEAAMTDFVFTKGPLAVWVDGDEWDMYEGGIMTYCGGQHQINHAVLVVGYDDVNHPPYWIIKNSWGASWGENGYIRILKGNNTCLISTHPSTAIV